MSNAVLKFLRKTHLYLGVFTTPALLFFAITGAMQTFSLHESTPGSSYKPPAWVATLAQLHKKQNTELRKGPRPLSNGAGTGAGSSQPPGDRDQRREVAQNPKAGTADGESRIRPEDGKAAKAPGLAVESGRNSHLPMKVFFLLVAVSLVLSAASGLYMAFKFERGAWQVIALLAAGLIVPLLLLPF